jgi:hypothetical protein
LCSESAVKEKQEYGLVAPIEEARPLTRGEQSLNIVEGDGLEYLLGHARR